MVLSLECCCAESHPEQQRILPRKQKVITRFLPQWCSPAKSSPWPMWLNLPRNIIYWHFLLLLTIPSSAQSQRTPALGPCSDTLIIYFVFLEKPSYLCFLIKIPLIIFNKFSVAFLPTRKGIRGTELMKCSLNQSPLCILSYLPTLALNKESVWKVDQE